MAPLEPISIRRVELITSMALGIDVVELFDGSRSEAKAREMIFACTFEVFVVWLWMPLL